jgi:hypothetical protein
VRYARFKISADGMRGALNTPPATFYLIRGMRQILYLAGLLHQLHIQTKAL